MNSTDFLNRRVLVIHPVSRGFGYAVFESPRRLVDWGCKSIRGGKIRATLTKAAALIEQYAPEILVLEDGLAAGSHRSTRVAQLLAHMKVVAVSKHIPTRRIPKHKIRMAFKAFEAETKEEIAYFLADKLCPLSPWLPRYKGGAGDHHRMPLFEAVALGFTYFYMRRVKEGPSRKPDIALKTQSTPEFLTAPRHALLKTTSHSRAPLGPHVFRVAELQTGSCSGAAVPGAA